MNLKKYAKLIPTAKNKFFLDQFLWGVKWFFGGWETYWMVSNFVYENNWLLILTIWLLELFVVIFVLDLIVLARGVTPIRGSWRIIYEKKLIRNSWEIIENLVMLSLSIK